MLELTCTVQPMPKLVSLGIPPRRQQSCAPHFASCDLEPTAPAMSACHGGGSHTCRDRVVISEGGCPLGQLCSWRRLIIMNYQPEYVPSQAASPQDGQIKRKRRRVPVPPSI